MHILVPKVAIRAPGNHARHPVRECKPSVVIGEGVLQKDRANVFWIPLHELDFVYAVQSGRHPLMPVCGMRKPPFLPCVDTSRHSCCTDSKLELEAWVGQTMPAHTVKGVLFVDKVEEATAQPTTTVLCTKWAVLQSSDPRACTPKLSTEFLNQYRECPSLVHSKCNLYTAG